MIRKAVIPAAGFGTRFLPASKSQPKEMLPIVDKPVIQYVVEEAVRAGITDILMVIGKSKRAIEEHFDRNFELETELREKGNFDALSEVMRISDLADIHFVWQKELKGLGDAIYCARHHVGNEPFAVLLGDTLLESDAPGTVTGQLLQTFEKYHECVVALESVDREKVSRYGVMDGSRLSGNTYRVRDFIEKPSVEESPSNLVIAGRYVLVPEIFSAIEQTGRGKNDEIQLTDAMRLLLRTRAMYGVRFEGRRYDVGNKLDFLKTNICMALKRDDLRDSVSAFIREIASDARAGQ